MIKKLFFIFFTTIIIFILIILYLNFIGIETNKFNSLIKNEIKSYNNRIDIKLNKVKLLLDINNLSLKIQTKNPTIIVEDKEVSIEKISTNISISSYLKNNFGIKNLTIITQENKIKDLLYINRSINNSASFLLLSSFIKKGNIKTIINLEFDEDGNLLKNYNLSGILKDVELRFREFENIDKINLNFVYKENNLKLENISLKIDQIKLNSKSILIKKIKSNYYIEGTFENNKTNISSKILNLIKINDDLYNKKEIQFKNFSKFSFKINKKFKIKDLSLQSNLQLYNLKYKGNKKNFKKYFSDYKENIKFEKININLKYDKKIFKIDGIADYNLNNNIDKIEFNVKKYKEVYDFNVNLGLNKNKLILDEINYLKSKNKKANLKIKGKFRKDKYLTLAEIIYSENKNKIILQDLRLNSKFKIITVKKIIFKYLTVNNIFNELSIIYKKPNYTVKGNRYDALKLIKEITDTDKKSNFFNLFHEVNSKITLDLKEVYLDKQNIAKNFKGSLKVKKNEIIDLNLSSNYSKNEKFFITIKLLDNNKKVTTLYSDRASPFVKNFKFIKGFEKGALDYNSLKNKGVSETQIRLYDFKIKEVPILAKLLTLASLQGIADLLTGEGIRFNEFEMNYTTKDKLITIEEIYSIGPYISILMEGYVQSKDLISLRGTLVPATTLNKAIGYIPLFGNILVGNKTGEGVFGVSFKIKGPPKNLKTTVNPIKTLTPRFITRTLEKIKKNN